jgi:hypothetical protein
MRDPAEKEPCFFGNWVTASKTDALYVLSHTRVSALGEQPVGMCAALAAGPESELHSRTPALAAALVCRERSRGHRDPGPCKLFHLFFNIHLTTKSAVAQTPRALLKSLPTKRRRRSRG